ncbi:hypothetical protein DDB_G0268182 [Dictyostelium discoideum AX4]|uniref:Uncharacterized protein n=1 Tax=Dictyostelium discoideum TaxID=44689 RepID=Q55FB3_DICDI|nr:hypothetical protein DDB_G0268182 [Dictyostelium discoideum AX4]EAL73544.1 hypothetical protein DDB_G0268182 [Dictyostelium discoideum AX4]|eukprot:XP_647620.1 hypothetical protein DDB_G0268182 [Dictyostelium discoideum AX4]
MASKLGFVHQATQNVLFKQPRFYLEASSKGQFADSIVDLSGIQRWNNDRSKIGNQFSNRFVKPSRVKFLRKKQVQKYKWDHFVYDVCKNYEFIRENAREISREPNRLAKIERANSWLGDYHQ